MKIRNRTHPGHRRASIRTACQRCGGRIPPVARRHGDPFCSRVCAEATYGTAARSAPGRMVIGGLPIRTSA
jgi:hypothetical protein